MTFAEFYERFSHFDIHHLPTVLDDLLDETGATVHRSTGKTGTDTEAEPDPKPKPSSAA